MTKRLLAVLILLLPGATSLRAQSDDEIKTQVARFFRAAESERSILLAEAEKTAAMGEAVAPFILAGLGERSPREITWGLRCLKAVKATSGRDQMLAFCRHESPPVRAEAIISLGALFPEAALEPARSLMADRDLTVRRRAIDALIALAPDDERTIDLAFAALVDGDFWICSRAVRLLSVIECETEAQKAALVTRCAPLVAKLDDRTAGLVIGLVAGKAGRLGLPVLVAAARRDLPAAQSAAFEAAGRLRADELVDLARPQLRGRDRGTRVAAIRYLACLRDRESMEPLVDLIERENEPAREAAVVALRQISGQTFGYEPEKWREWLAKNDTARN